MRKGTSLNISQVLICRIIHIANVNTKYGFHHSFPGSRTKRMAPEYQETIAILEVDKSTCVAHNNSKQTSQYDLTV